MIIVAAMLSNIRLFLYQLLREFVYIRDPQSSDRLMVVILVVLTD